MLEVGTVAQLISAGGVVGALLFMVWGFYTGNIWPSKHVDKLIEESNAVQSELADKICDKIEGAVSRGIQSGVKAANGQK